MGAYPYQFDPGVDTAPKLGLIALQSDETIENDFRRLIPDSGVSLFHSRVRSAPEVTRETLAQMEHDLPNAAAMMPAAAAFDVVGYGCTSGTSVIGPGRIAELVKEGCETKAVTEPLSALVAACAHLGIARIAFLSPYVEAVSATLRGALNDQGIATPVFGSFEEGEESKVVRIDGPSVIRAACELVEDAAVDAIFMSCTNLRTLDVIQIIEDKTGLPALSSNQVLAWHMMRLAGQTLRQPGYGRLLA